MTRTMQRQLYAAFKAGALDSPKTGDHAMTDTHDRHGYPIKGFFVAHRRYVGPSIDPKYPWGNINDLDGPIECEDALIEGILEAWKDDQHAPDTDDLRVWHIIPGKPAEDCTAWAVRTANETIELRMERWNT